MFPIEVWEEILQNSCAKDLLRMRIVSKTWNGIILRILQTRSDVWYRQCVCTIPEEFWSSMLEHQVNNDVDCDDFHKASENASVWYEMYKSWMKWRNVVRMVPQIGTFEPLPQHRILERITCVAVLSNIIAIGTSEGYINFYNLARDEIFFRADHAEYLDNVQLFREGERVMAVSSSIRGRLKFWNLAKKAEEKSLACNGSLISTSFGYCYSMRDNQFAGFRLSDCSNSLEGQRKSSESHRINLSGCVSVGDSFVALGADGKDVTLYTRNNRSLRVTWKYDVVTKTADIDKPNIEVRYYRIFKAGVIACVGVLGELGLSINGRWKIYDLFGKFAAQVTTVLFHVAVLALGLQSGDVHLFSIKDVRSLTNLDFNAMASRKLKLDTRAIISLNVTEYNSSQYLVASSNRHIHLVKFVWP